MNVTSEIKSYIELKETCGALLLTGKWGCGKSYIMHQLADSLNGEDQYAVAIVSLFGVQSIEELDKKVKEAIELLKGNGPKDLLELTLTIGSNMLLCAKKAESIEEARKMLMENIENGKGLEKLKDFVKAQGGDISPIDDYSKFPQAKYIEKVISPVDGYITKIHAEAFGLIAMELGAGRATKESEIDLAVGIVLNKKRGEKVNKGDVLAYIHANSEGKIEKARKSILENIVIEDKYDLNIPLIYDIVR